MSSLTQSTHPNKNSVVDVERKTFGDKLSLNTLISILDENPEVWAIRKEAARILFDNCRYEEAAELVWAASEIPSIDLEIAFVARIVSRGTPRRSIRLLKHVLAQNAQNPIKLLAIANALMHYGMVMQAARFYGAASACDDTLDNGDLEHFLLWLDDSQRLWGDWEKDGQPMDKLPWVKRDQGKDPNYEKTMSGLTTPIKVTGLNKSTSEHLISEYYRQLPEAGGEITAPPAVTIPLDRINLDEVLYDERKGAALTPAKKNLKEPLTFERPEGVPVMATGPSEQREPLSVHRSAQASHQAISPEVERGEAAESACGQAPIATEKSVESPKVQKMPKPTILVPRPSEGEPRKAKLLF